MSLWWLHVITCIQLHFAISIISPLGRKWFTRCHWATPRPPTATLSEGWMTSDPGRHWPSTQRVCETYDLFRYYNCLSIQGIPGCTYNKNQWKSCVWPMLGLTGTILQWHIEVFCFLFQDYPRIQMHMFHIALTYIFNKQPIKGCLPQCVNQQKNGWGQWFSEGDSIEIVDSQELDHHPQKSGWKGKNVWNHWNHLP